MCVLATINTTKHSYLQSIYIAKHGSILHSTHPLEQRVDLAAGEILHLSILHVHGNKINDKKGLTFN